MSKFSGGIFSKSRGKLSGIVFSAARAREGKVMTAREFVIPANPQTDQQMANRGIFDFVQAEVRNIGPDVYKNDWNRAVQDLPGYQSLLSLLRRPYREISSSPGAFFYIAESLNPATLLGSLHVQDSLTVSRPSGTQTQFTWSTENGENGSPSDTAVAIAVLGRVDEDDTQWWSVLDISADRSDGSVTLTHPNQTSANGVLTIFYMRNPANEVPDKLSNAIWNSPPTP